MRCEWSFNGCYWKSTQEGSLYWALGQCRRDKKAGERRGEPVSVFSNTASIHSLPKKTLLLCHNELKCQNAPCRRPVSLFFVSCVWSQAIGDFKIHRRDGNENVPKNLNLPSFSFYRSYSYPLSLSNVGEPPEVEFQATLSWLRKRNKISSEKTGNKKRATCLWRVPCRGSRVEVNNFFSI